MILLHIGNAHPRNIEFIQRMCKKKQIDYLYSEHPIPGIFDIIWAPSAWINPDQYPTAKILFGPHLWVLPDKDNIFFRNQKPEHGMRCVFTGLSPWILALYDEFVNTSTCYIPFLALPFGLPASSLSIKDYKYDCLFYFKHRHPSLREFGKSMLDSMGLSYKVFDYGSYDRNAYLNALNECKFCIWIGCHESQGFGFQECLASNTPIFVFDVMSLKEECNTQGNFYYTEHVTKQLNATTAAYWDNRCGMKVYSKEEFQEKLPFFLKSLSNYQPAKFFNETLSDDICIQRFFSALNLDI